MENKDQKIKELEETIAKIRQAFKAYKSSDGCGCCGDYEQHKINNLEMGRLLGAEIKVETYANGMKEEWVNWDNEQ